MAKGDFGGKRFKKGKITIDVGGKKPTDIGGLAWKQIYKQGLWEKKKKK